MRSLKRSRAWLMLSLVLAMVTLAMAPARVPACAVHSAAAIDGPAASPGVCASTGRPGHCCCGETAATSPAQLKAARSGGTQLNQPGCNCALQAAPTTPAAIQVAGAGHSTPAITAPQHRTPPARPAASAWRLTTFATGPPRTPYSPSSPPRGSPAC